MGLHHLRDNWQRYVEIGFDAAMVLMAILIICLLVSCGGSRGQVRRVIEPPGAGPISAKLEKLQPERPAGPGEASGREKARAQLDSAARVVGWIAGLCALAAAATLVLSFFPGIGALVPTKASAGCLAAALAGWGVSYLLNVYGVLFSEIAIWATVAVGVAIAATTGVPWVLAWHRASLKRLSAKLAADPKHIDAAVALEAVATDMPAPARRQRVSELRARTGSKP